MKGFNESGRLRGRPSSFRGHRIETPTDRRLLAAGRTYIETAGPHLQAAPHVRRSLVLILAPQGAPALVPGGDWRPTGFGDR
ncbi:hypothetical protein [Pseudoxanthomonas winnipegensis]|uniref:Uncharacterized protein n=1 Tax=Pseudoxanthomonas winnipegensis TaxID=2480810 RepID=A0A4Q8LYK0_9GAMM|nr:hypothetical protein [Pseudoxanthomonas winnipegensis]RZZ87114.1 hypothetical protein EA663_09650 [Pseudoxanthomonas winnipegensis]TAA37678.1 hypothetical protein EA656_03180 [Pseudoxanthomonas winnipegensis]